MKLAFVYFDNFHRNDAHVNSMLNTMTTFSAHVPVTLVSGWFSPHEMDDRMRFVGFQRRFSYLRMPVRLLLGSRRAEMLTRALFSACAWLTLLVRRYDAIFTSDFGFLLFLSYLPHFLRPRSIVVFEAHKVYHVASRKVSFEQEARALTAADRLVVITEGIRDDMHERFGIPLDRILLAPGGVNTDTYRDLGLERRKELVYSGSFLHWKGTDTLVRALPHVRTRDLVVRLIGGTPQEMEGLRDLIRKERIEYPLLELVGMLPQEALARELNQAMVAVIPNQVTPEGERYTSPMKVPEYMACGLPVISSDLPSMREVMSEENAAYFPPSDHEALARVIDDLFADPDRIATMRETNIREGASRGWSARAGRVIPFVFDVTRKAESVCLLSMQILGRGKIGGFGSMTRQLAASLAAEGKDVTVLVPKVSGIREVDERDGYRVIVAPLSDIFALETYRLMGADVYHSQNPSLLSYFARQAEPGKLHVVTCRDPRGFEDWITEWRFATWSRRAKIPFNLLFEESWWTREAVRRADVVAVPARYLAAKVAALYGVKGEVRFLPNIEHVPDTVPEKPDRPAVCFVGRLDMRKRPELFIRMAGAFPEVAFLVVGTAEDAERQAELEQLAASFPNVEMLGYQDKFGDDLRETYRRSRVLVNTSAREGLPLTFIEAAAHGCAILAASDPDGFATRFGMLVEDEDYVAGLRKLLEGDAWKTKGEAGHAYVRETYGAKPAVRAHLDAYDEALARHAKA